MLRLTLTPTLPQPLTKVEYLPCSLATGGAALLRDFLQRLLPPDARDVRRSVESKALSWPAGLFYAWPAGRGGPRPEAGRL